METCSLVPSSCVCVCQHHGEVTSRRKSEGKPSSPGPPPPGKESARSRCGVTSQQHACFMAGHPVWLTGLFTGALLLPRAESMWPSVSWSEASLWEENMSNMIVLSSCFGFIISSRRSYVSSLLCLEVNWIVKKLVNQRMFRAAINYLNYWPVSYLSLFIVSI